MSKFLVTGGAGFIGSHVVDELVNRGNEVVVLDNFIGGKHNIRNFHKSVKMIEGDVCYRKNCKEALKGVDAVFHIAAHAAEGQSVFIPAFNAKTNLLGSVTLLSEAISQGIREFVFTSSIAAYGRPQQLPISEAHPLNPEDPYGISKKAFEDYLRVYHELGVLDPYIVRFFNVYGPRQRMDDPYRGVVPIFINKCLKGEDILVFGDGSQSRAFTYVKDIVEPICNIVGRKELVNKPINIGSEEVCSVKKLGEMIIKKMGAKVKIQKLPERPTDVKHAYCDIGRAKQLLGYSAKVSLDQGLDMTIEWAKKEGSKPFRYMEQSEIDKLRHNAYKERKI